MAPPFYNDITKNVNTLLNNDYYHSQVASFEVSTVAKNGVKFNVKSKQSTQGAPLSSTIETKINDKSTGLTLTQSWSNANNLNTKVELADILTQGLKTELITSMVPNVSKNAKFNVSFVQPSFTARGNFDLLTKPSFVGDLSLAHDGIVGGLQFGYDITQGSLSSYALALAYNQSDYSLGLSINNKQFTTVSFFQNVSSILQVGAKATANVASASNVNIEFATKYVPDETSQVKAKIQDTGILALAYKQELRKGVTLGLGASFNALNLNEPVHKLGGSLTFSA
ncbi:hypothetical protein Kpol_1003p19 [Vanderwaltozyma polyspora DSM 70294]|uniref:Mitochondrial outer membrane protein porin 1 n=1 Tax=Vanderwaltozyma polyspora (strain ATCC 22028 / DSM 70294 / BCRC 21397 / CBS 2163 / NBRC 10782 / NRRL Y-8283 / UCD 57-17) TaxID=436907 RepID=A7TLX7_VANPO|nr:uncharacterized protein Kpol_1003p19 [Vanderwaltozyma polyspora DSM 70294]EDO16714.1 hypothetical protein Kpol_1003p19 [Vanderwaltozyma polyspora DSM 70294]